MPVLVVTRFGGDFDWANTFRAGADDWTALPAQLRVAPGTGDRVDPSLAHGTPPDPPAAPGRPSDRTRRSRHFEQAAAHAFASPDDTPVPPRRQRWRISVDEALRERVTELHGPISESAFDTGAGRAASRRRRRLRRAATRCVRFVALSGAWRATPERERGRSTCSRWRRRPSPTVCAETSWIGGTLGRCSPGFWWWRTTRRCSRPSIWFCSATASASQQSVTAGQPSSRRLVTLPMISSCWI